jgi:hypothetical protein
MIILIKPDFMAAASFSNRVRTHRICLASLRGYSENQLKNHKCATFSEREQFGSLVHFFL